MRFMSMDLMSGTIVLTSVFLLVLGLTVMRPAGLPPDMVARIDELRRRKVLTTVFLIVYFLGITDVFIITQQHYLAYLNLSVGVCLTALQFFSSTAPAAEGEMNSTDPSADVPEPSPSHR